MNFIGLQSNQSSNLKRNQWKKEKQLIPTHQWRKDKSRIQDSQLQTAWTSEYLAPPLIGCNPCHHSRVVTTTLGRASCYDPRPYPQFSAISYHFILHSRSLVPHSFPHAPLGPPLNHLTSHLMDHLTIPQPTITCHHSAVRSIPQYHHLTLYGLPAHCHIMMGPPAHNEAILRTASS